MTRTITRRQLLRSAGVGAVGLGLSGVLGEINLYKAGQHLPSEHVNHYVTDGEITAASLVVEV